MMRKISLGVGLFIIALFACSKPSQRLFLIYRMPSSYDETLKLVLKFIEQKPTQDVLRWERLPINVEKLFSPYRKAIASLSANKSLGITKLQCFFQSLSGSEYLSWSDDYTWILCVFSKRIEKTGEEKTNVLVLTPLWLDSSIDEPTSDIRSVIRAYSEQINPSYATVDFTHVMDFQSKWLQYLEKQNVKTCELWQRIPAPKSFPCSPITQFFAPSTRYDLEELKKHL